MQKFYNEFIKPGALCYDIGANVGDYSEVFLGLGARVLAVEPIDENVSALRARLGHHNNMSVLSMAVSSFSGTAEIYKANSTELSSLNQDFVQLNKNQSEFFATEKHVVQLTTLDELISETGLPHYCKIDVEGHEKEVLKGLSQPIPIISFEYLYPFRSKATDCIRLLTNLSATARFNYSLFEFFELENCDWIKGETFIKMLDELSPDKWTGDIFCRLD